MASAALACATCALVVEVAPKVLGFGFALVAAALVGSGRPMHTRTVRQTSWTQIDAGDADQGFLLYMLHLRERRGWPIVLAYGLGSMLNNVALVLGGLAPATGSND